MGDGTSRYDRHEHREIQEAGVLPRSSRPLIPGAGQWYGGRIRRAVLVFLPTLVLVALMAAFWSRGAVRIVELLVQPAVLWTLLAVNLVVLLWRGFVVVDAFQVARDGTRPGWLAVAVLSVTLMAVAAPHVVFVAYDLEAIDLLESVFVDGEVAAPVFEEDPPPSTAQSIPGDTLPIEVPDPALVEAPDHRHAAIDEEL